jgi:hypothetical protein
MFDDTPEEDGVATQPQSTDDVIVTEPQSDPRQNQIVQNVASMRKQGATDSEVETYLRDVEKLPYRTSPTVNQAVVDADANKYHKAYQSGALAKTVAEGKARDLAEAGGEDLFFNPINTPEAKIQAAQKRADKYTQVLGAGVAPLNAVRYLGLPVGRAVTTGSAMAGQALTGQTPDWKQAYRQVAAAEKSAPTALTLPGALIGGAASLALPGNAKMLSTGPGVAASGAISALTDLNPDKNLWSRAIEAPFAAAFDYGLGKGINYVANTDLAATGAGKIAELAKKMGAKSPTLDALTQFAKMTPAERDAVRRASTAQARDVKEGNAPAAPLPTAPALAGQPTAMGVDIAGPNMVAQARGAAQSTGGRTAFEGPFAAREEAAVPSITSGTEDAMRELQRLKQSRGATAIVDKEAAVQPTTGIPITITPEMQEIFDTPTGQRVVKAAMRSRRNMPMRPLPEVETQVPIPSGKQVTADVVDLRLPNGTLRSNYENVPDKDLHDAINALHYKHAEETGVHDSVAENPALERYRESTSGLAEEAFGVARKPPKNMSKALEEDFEGSNDEYMSNEDKARAFRIIAEYRKRELPRQAEQKAIERMDAELTKRLKSKRYVPTGAEREAASFEFGANVAGGAGAETPSGNLETVMQQVPDQEALHIMTQILGHAAGMEGKQPNPTGKAAIDARSAKWMREQLQGQLGPEFQTFIANYRNASRPIRALNIGRTPGQLNPAIPEGGGKVPPSLSDLRAEMRTMTPTEREALQTGKRFDIASRLNTGTLSPEQIAKAMKNLGSPLAQEMEIAGGPMAGRAQNWASALGRQREIMPSRGPTATEEAGPPLIDNLATTAKWLTRNFAKAGLGSASDKAKATQSLRDQAFARLLTQSPDALLQSIASQGARQQSRKLGSNVAANTTLDYLRGLF